MKSIANIISIVRIFLVISLLFIKPLSVEFFIIYFLSGISDILDGYIARKTKTTSKLGEKLDSFADLIMVIILIILLVPILKLPVKIIDWIIIIALIRVVSLIIAFKKYKIFGSLHTYLNKLTGFLLFISPVLFVTIPKDLVLYGICIIATISAMEEVIINIVSSEFHANIKSIIVK